MTTIHFKSYSKNFITCLHHGLKWQQTVFDILKPKQSCRPQNRGSIRIHKVVVHREKERERERERDEVRISILDCNFIGFI